jgi:hypothetical protein
MTRLKGLNEPMQCCICGRWWKRDAPGWAHDPKHGIRCADEKDCAVNCRGRSYQGRRTHL